MSDNTSLFGAIKTTVTTDLSGNLPVTSLGSRPNGTYNVVVDYNGDGIYTEGLDALRPVWVQTSQPPLPGMPPPSPPLPGSPPAPSGLSLDASLNPAYYSQAVTLTARFTYPGPNGMHPGAQIAFFDGAKLLGVVDMNQGEATLGLGTVNTLLAGGSHAITAYPITPGGESEFSASLNLVINPDRKSVV